MGGEAAVLPECAEAEAEWEDRAAALPAVPGTAGKPPRPCFKADPAELKDCVDTGPCAVSVPRPAGPATLRAGVPAAASGAPCKGRLRADAPGAATTAAAVATATALPLLLPPLPLLDRVAGSELPKGADPLAGT